MLKFLARDSLTFDVETIPDVEAGRRLLCGPVCSDGMTDDDVRTRMFEHAGATPENRQPFLKPILQQVVSVAAVRRSASPDGVKIKLITSENADERTMIKNILALVGLSGSMQLVGFNSEGFDLPLLVQRALVHSLAVPSFCKRPDKPWEGRDLHARYSDWHVDLMHELGGFGKSVPSLSEACAALNILGGAKDITGADVLDLYLAGDLTAIRQYNAKDAVRHFLILLRLCVLAGHVSPEQAAREEADVCQQLEAYCAAPAAVEA